VIAAAGVSSGDPGVAIIGAGFISYFTHRRAGDGGAAAGGIACARRAWRASRSHLRRQPYTFATLGGCCNATTSTSPSSLAVHPADTRWR
jgi:hypothetical protein